MWFSKRLQRESLWVKTKGLTRDCTFCSTFTSKVNRSGAPGFNMAGRYSLQEVDLSCAICCDIFKNPVVLACSHSFCSPCLQQYWAPRGRERDCPLCRTQARDDPVPSLTLRNLCEAYLQDMEDVGETGGELCGEPGEVCPLHGERMKLFCLADKEPICVVCHTSRRHKQHDCCPVSEAILDVKVDVRRSASPTFDQSCVRGFLRLCRHLLRRR